MILPILIGDFKGKREFIFYFLKKIWGFERFFVPLQRQKRTDSLQKSKKSTFWGQIYSDGRKWPLKKRLKPSLTPWKTRSYILRASFRTAPKNQGFMYANLYNMAILKVLKRSVSSLKSMIYVGLRVKVPFPLSQGLKLHEYFFKIIENKC